MPSPQELKEKTRTLTERGVYDTPNDDTTYIMRHTDAIIEALLAVHQELVEIKKAIDRNPN